MPQSKRLLRFVPLVALCTAALAAPPAARACPPSLTVEQPTAGLAAGRGAFLVLRAASGCHPGALAVSGVAEGLVGGQRRSVPLVLDAGGEPDVYLVRAQWPREGVWVLRLTVAQGDGRATTLVGIDGSGRVATVRRPPQRGTIPPVSDADVARLLRSLAAG